MSLHWARRTVLIYGNEASRTAWGNPVDSPPSAAGPSSSKGLGDEVVSRTSGISPTLLSRGNPTSARLAVEWGREAELPADRQ